MRLSATISILALAIAFPVLAADPNNLAPEAGSKSVAILEQGKKIFVARCAQCHNDDASKKLPDGSTLLRRLAQSKDPEARLGTRLKDPQERHAVMIYLDSLLTHLRASDAGEK